jgi:G6PDH family F420-dependent oxidoreductase
MSRKGSSKKSGKKGFEVAVDIGENESDPQEFKECVILSEKLGYDVAWLGDHFMPWAHSSDRSAYVWSLMGSCLEATRKIRLGPYVTTPIGARYHPLIIAQAAATLDNMYPGRFLLTVGTGEAMNEVPFFERWPSWNERMERLVEGVQMIRKMWESKSFFDFDGKYFKANQVYLYTRPRTDMKIYISGVGPKMARAAGEFGDGLITLSHANPLERCRDVIFPLFEEGARSVGKDPSKMEKIVSLSFTFKDPETFARTERRYAGIIAKRSFDEPDPRKIEQMGMDLPAEEIIKSTAYCKNWNDVIELISKFKDLGVTQIVLQTGTDKKLIRTFGQKVLPHFKKK